MRTDKNAQTDTDCFDSAFCNVTYVPKDNVVLLTWKAFCRLEDYRTPALFAANLLLKHPNSNLIIDARRGFEDDKTDVAWGFSVLLPKMAQSDCKKCIFIRNAATNLDGEIDLWTKEFQKHFTVAQASSYAEAVKQL